MNEWVELQEESAALFRSLGCKADVDITIKGARAEHKVDVWVIFDRFGLETSWVIECKSWKTAIPKEKVLALKAIVEDVGADRGILISKVGFQSGAFRAAQSTNITLTSLNDLKETVKDDLMSSIVSSLETKAIRIRDSIGSLYKTTRTGPNSLTSTPLPGVDASAIMHAGGELAVLQQGFECIRIGKSPFPVTFDKDNNLLAVDSVEKFVKLESSIIEKAAAIVDSQHPRPAVD